MPLTTKQVSKRLNRSIMTVYKYIHLLTLKDHKWIRETYIDKNHKRVITEKLFNELKKVVNGKHYRERPNRKIYVDKITDLLNENKELRHRLEHDNNTARRSINDKRNQISKLNDHIAKQDRNLDQQQQLQLNSQNELKLVRNQLHTAKNSLLTYKKKKSSKDTKPNKRPVKHNFWWHLTHKW